MKPAARGSDRPAAIPEKLIDEAILLRREVPGRSIPQIIEILEMEGRAPEGFLKRTTPQDKLQKRGYSARQPGGSRGRNAAICGIAISSSVRF